MRLSFLSKSVHSLFTFALFLWGIESCCQAVLPCTPRSQSTEAWNRSRDGIRSDIANRDVKILFLGDSITARWASVGKGLWDTYFIPLKAYNAGIEGETTQGLLWRIEQADFASIKPEKVVLLIGTNNLDSEPNAVIEGVEAVAIRLKRAFPSAGIIVLAILPRDSAESINRMKLMRVNKSLAARATASGYFFCDVGGRLQQEDGTLIPEAYLPDLLHLTALGYGFIVEPIHIMLMNRLY